MQDKGKRCWVGDVINGINVDRTVYKGTDKETVIQWISDNRNYQPNLS